MAPIFILLLIFVVFVFWMRQRLSFWKRFFLTGLLTSSVIFIYVSFGNPDLKDYPARFLRENQAGVQALKKQEQRLRGYLQMHPNDCKAWRLLGETYQVLGQKAAAGHIQPYAAHVCGLDPNSLFDNSQEVGLE